MPGKIHSDDEPIVDINITPFVDIVLVLLIIFMVTAQFIVGRGINLDLPSAKNTEGIQKQNNLTISILRDTSYVLDNKQMNISEIQKFIDKKFKNKSMVSITINADKLVPYNTLVQLMDGLRVIGVTKFALQMNTTKKSSP